MPEYTHPVRNKSSLPEARHVEIKDESGKWIPTYLKRRTDYVGGKGYEVRWQVVGTLEGYTAAQLNNMYKSGTLRIIENCVAVDDFSTPAPTRKRQPYVPGGYDKAVGADLTGLYAELGEENGRNSDIRQQLAGMNDFKISFEDDARQHSQKLIFFRGARTFLGSLPFYDTAQHAAWRVAHKVAVLCGIDRSRGVVGNPKKHTDAFQGSLTVRCEHSFRAREIANEIANLIGFQGKTHIHHLGHSATREIHLRVGVRETGRRVGREVATLRRAS